MNWETIEGILLGLGLLAWLIGFSIQLWPERWLSRLLMVVLVAVTLLSGDWQSPDNEGTSASSQRASQWWLAGGWICFLLGGTIMILVKNLS
jgi:hypothetical protein